MSDLFWFSDRQFALMRPYFSLALGVPSGDDRKVISGIIHVIRNGRAGAPHWCCSSSHVAGRH